MPIVCLLMLFWMRWNLQWVIERDVKDDIVMQEEGGIYVKGGI